MGVDHDVLLFLLAYVFNVFVIEQHFLDPLRVVNELLLGEVPQLLANVGVLPLV